MVLVEEIADFIRWIVYMERCESKARGKTRNTFPKIKLLYSKASTEDEQSNSIERNASKSGKSEFDRMINSKITSLPEILSQSQKYK